MSVSPSKSQSNGDNQNLVRPDQRQREMAVAALALLALAIICGLAFFAPPEKVALADEIALGFLAIVFIALLWPPLLQALEERPGATTFLLTAAMFVIYSMARRVVPENGWSIRFAGMLDDEYIFPYSAYVVVLGALLSSPFWWRRGNPWLHAFLAGLAIIAGISAWAFWLLARYYPVGAAQRLDPSELPNLALMLIEYACLAVLCRAVCANVTTRRIAFKVLPIVLLALCARFHFIKPAEDAE